MFSHCYQIGESIEIYNTQDKKLFSKWGFIGKHSKVYDPHLHTYEMVLSTGNLSKMEIPKNSNNNKKQTLSLFQGFIVFQIYLFTSKQITIEIAISDTTNAKRRLIFSSNNSDLVINQLHCRIPIFKFPIGRWVNFSIDILSFVSKCYKDLTFRSVDYISLSMSGKVRYIFTMRTPLIEKNNNFELDEEGNIINYDMELNDLNSKNGENSEISNFSPGAKDVPDKYKFPPHEEIINMNIDCNKVFSQIYIENENKQIIMSQKDLNRNPILKQDTSNAINMNKSLKYRYDIYKNEIRNKKNKMNYYFYDNNFYNDEYQKNNNINNEFENYYGNNDYNEYNNKVNYIKNFSHQNDLYNKQKNNRFNNVGNLIMSHNVDKKLNNKIFNQKSTYNFERKNINLNLNNNNFRDINNDINQNELINEKEFINLSKDKDNEKNDNLFNIDEYKNLYSKGKGVINQIKKNLKINDNNFANDFDDKKINYQLNEINNNDNFDYNFDIEKEMIENEKNNGSNERPFSPPITKLEKLEN